MRVKERMVSVML